MKKILIYLLIFSVTTELVVPMFDRVQAQEMPSFTLDFGGTPTPEPEPTPDPTPDPTPEPTPEPETTPTIPPPTTIPQTITATTTLSSKKEYHGGTNKFQIVRRNFSDRPKRNQTVSIDDAVARNTTLSNSVLTVQKKEEIIVAKETVKKTLTPTEQVIDIDNTTLFSGDTQVASAGETDTNTSTIALAKASLVQPTALSKKIAKKIVSIAPKTETTSSQTKKSAPKENISNKPSEVLRTLQVNEDISSFLTVPKTYQSTTLTKQESIEKSIQKFTWSRFFQKTWDILTRTFQLFVISWLLILLEEKYRKKLALFMLSSHRRRKSKLFKTKQVNQNIVPPEEIYFECRKIRRSALPDRPYYKLFYGTESL